MRRLFEHVERWKNWKENNANGQIHKFLVLLGIVHSPTFNLTLTNYELNALWKAVKN